MLQKDDFVFGSSFNGEMDRVIICQCNGKKFGTGATCQDIAGLPSAMLNVKV